MAKRKCLSPKSVECLRGTKENMAIVDNFIKNGGYTFKKYTDNTNSFKKVELEERDVEPDEEDEFLFELEDIDEEEVILYLEDFYDSTDET